MRLLVLLLICGFGRLVVASDDGEPGCKTMAEVQNCYRHANDPTKYWCCAALNSKAVLRRCADNTAYSEVRRACIPWIDWVWTPAVEPPSHPDGYTLDQEE